MSRLVIRSSAALIGLLAACSSPSGQPAATSAAASSRTGMATVQDDQSAKDVVKIAAGSADHSTLVTAVKAAGLLDVLASSGPYTVFAPTNAAFDKLPEGTVKNLLKPENLAALQGVLRHHVTTSAYQLSELSDGQVLSMADGKPASIAKKGSDTFFGNAKVLASVRGTNGIVHVIDAVVLAEK
jgi:uncharacterized surface protein with fasciclin (FAS1) repeats